MLKPDRILALSSARTGSNQSVTQRGRKTEFKRPLWEKAIEDDKEPPAPPAHLAKEERALWRQVLEGFDIEDDPVALSLLAAALDAHARARLCRAQIDKEGLTVRGKGGVPKPHPLLGAERAARQQLVSALKKLKVEL